MKILVTGAKGFVGKNLCWALKNIKDGKDRRFEAVMPGTDRASVTRRKV